VPSLAEFGFIFAANFIFIGCKAAQNRNSVGGHYKLFGATSYVMAAMEVFVIHKIAIIGPTIPMVLTVGTAAATGGMAAMWLHHRWVPSRD